MGIALLILIYLAFISLGLPDGLLGAAWPSVYPAFSVPVSYAGYVTMIIAGGTIISSLSSDRLSQKISTQWILVISVALTALAIFGFSFSNAYWMLCLWAIPYGLGAGAVDSSLNNYVSLHYHSRQMSWLHSFWGVGATLGPYIISLALGHNLGWEWGYRIVGFIQVALVVILLCSAPLWQKNAELTREEKGPEVKREHLGFFKTWTLKGTAFVFLSFFAYCSLETTSGLWAASYFVLNRGLSEEMAASWASLFYLGIALGRFLMGFIADKLRRLQHGAIRLNYLGGRLNRPCHPGGLLYAFGGLAFDWLRLRAGLSEFDPRDPHELWGRAFPRSHWHRDGDRLCRLHLHATVIWSPH